MFDPIDMGHQSSITQLKGLKQKLKPEDLNPQFYRANREGITKYEGGVKTLENNLKKNFYPEQKKLYKKAQKFINAGQEIPADLQNKIITSNEKIQKFINKTVKQYPLLKDRVNAITIDPNDLTVKRGDNVLKQLGIGLVDQDLGDIKLDSIDDLTIKANLAQQTLREAVDAGLIDEVEGQKKLDEFLKVKNPKIEELLKIEGVTTADKIEQPKKSKIRNMFDSFNQKYMSSKPVIQKFSSKVPGSAAVLAPYDAAMMLLSGAPAYDALASGASYLTNDPLIGKAVNIPLALREMTNYGDEKEMFQRATERREGIESMLEGLPSRFKSYINENRGIDDETEEFVP